MATPRPLDLLRDAIEAARAALRDLDQDQIPPRVRRVAAYSGGSLPPPLARSLLAELEANEFLRTKALEAWAAPSPATGRARASHAFLDRQGGWVEVVMAEALAAGERHGAATDESVLLERDALQAEVAGAQERLRRQREEHRSREGELRAALDEARSPGRAGRAAEERLRARLDEEIEARQAAKEAFEHRLAAARAEIARHQESLRLERRERADLNARLDDGGLGSLPVDPAALARHLDDLAAHAAALVMRPAPSAQGGDASRSRLGDDADLSVRPDTAVAIDRLIAASGGSILVDGYNLGFLLAPSDAGQARALATEACRRLAAVTSGSVTIVFDSSMAEAGGGASRSGNLEVAYTSGRTADDAIVARVTAGDVVITNDRELRERAEARGAMTLWSTALAEWSRRR